MQETWVQSLGWEDPLDKGTLPTPVFWPGEFHGLYSPWGCKESDMTEQLSLHFICFKEPNISFSTMVSHFYSPVCAHKRVVTGIRSFNFTLPRLPTEDHTCKSHQLWSCISLPQILGDLKKFIVRKDVS